MQSISGICHSRIIIMKYNISIPTTAQTERTDYYNIRLFTLLQGSATSHLHTERCHPRRPPPHPRGDIGVPVNVVTVR